MLHEVFMSQRVDVLAKSLIRHKVDIDIADHGVMSIRKMAFTRSPAVSVMHSLIRKYDGTTQLMKYQVYHLGPVSSTNKYYSRYCELICYLFLFMNNV